MVLRRRRFMHRWQGPSLPTSHPLPRTTLPMKTMASQWRSLAGAAAVAAVGLIALPAHAGEEPFTFAMVRSPALSTSPNCVPNARATVRIEPRGPVEEMHVRVEGLPPDTE